MFYAHLELVVELIFIFFLFNFSQFAEHIRQKSILNVFASAVSDEQGFPLVETV